MEKIYEQDRDKYIKGLIKVDALIGPMECIDWVSKKIKEYNEQNVKKQNGTGH